jgi:hypothetical protein
VIGATIAGGGGAADTSSIPSHKSRGRGAAKVRPPQFGVTSIFQTVTANWGTVGGGGSNNAGGVFSVVAGGYGNVASGSESTIGGGDFNTASGSESTVSGGSSNSAVAYGDTVGGGADNVANSSTSCINGITCYATVAGGTDNHADNEVAAIGGGSSNYAQGVGSTVPGGALNSADGDYSFAAGNFATAGYNNSFVWSDGNPAFDTGIQQFVAQASGGFFFYTNFNSSTGAELPSGSGSWSSVSDRNVKDNFAAIDGDSLLTKIAAMPISTWNYKTQATSIRHMGPMAQDFRSAFGLGEDEKHISNIDSEGVALAAIQALYKLNQEKDGKIAELTQAVQQLKTEVDTLKDSSRKH